VPPGPNIEPPVGLFTFCAKGAMIGAPWAAGLERGLASAKPTRKGTSLAKLQLFTVLFSGAVKCKQFTTQKWNKLAITGDSQAIS